MMTAFQVFMVCLAGFSALLWLWELFAAWYTGKTMPIIRDFGETAADKLPKLSVIIPACNEGMSLAAAMEKRLADDYGNLEFILIDDRSRDDTRRIIQRIAACDERVKPVYIDDLPAGWLGKVHALHKGAELATGEWLLFSDADVHIEKGTLNRVVSYCLREKLDHAAVLPELFPAPYWVMSAVAIFMKALITAGTTWRIRKLESRAYAGSGAFSLVRREAFEQTEGFAWLKMEVVDDLCLGMMIKRAGFSSDMLNGLGCVGLYWYTNFRDMKNGVGRALFAGLGNYSGFQLVFIGVFGFLLDAAPWLCLLPLGVPYLQLSAAGLCVISLAASVLSARLLNIRLIPALMLPAANVLVLMLTVGAAVRGARQGGIVWRGTFYSKKDLKRGRRLRF